MYSLRYQRSQRRRLRALTFSSTMLASEVHLTTISRQCKYSDQIAHPVLASNTVSSHDRPQEEFIRVINTNVIGTSNVTQRFIPLLRKRGEHQIKKIVNISSIIGSITATDASRESGQGPVYGISKTALNMLTRLTANHLRSENFIVFAIHPGWVSTDLGGPSAPVTSQESVRGILNKIEQCQSTDSGEFFDYTGASLDW